jgi:hypothetical protein
LPGTARGIPLAAEIAEEGLSAVELEHPGEG